MTDDAPVEGLAANPGYAAGQLARALLTADQHTDPEVRQRAQAKIDAWTKVFVGMLDGALTVGSRTPVRDTPAWATLEVVTGGFATGELLAAGPLRPHETAWLERLGQAGAVAPRAVLNAHFLTEAGLDQLREMLAGGRYRIELPEEGALLVVAWLFDHGHGDRARAVLDAIAPFLGRLRFYPMPHDVPLDSGVEVHLQPVADTIAGLERLPEQERVLAQREAALVWAPLLDRMVALMLETVEGALPAVATDARGKPIRNPDSTWPVTGGWPCQHYPEGWRERAAAVLADFRQLRATHRRCRKPERAKENLARLRGYLEQCVAEPRALSGRDVTAIRTILAHVLAKRGVPDSARCRGLRAGQARAVASPTAKELAQAVVERLRAYRADDGLDAIDPLLVPVTADEAAALGLPAGASLERFRRRLLRSLDAPVDALVDAGVIPSSEVLARVIPQITAQVTAAGIDDLVLRRLYGAVYQAFRRRRSLLLLNLESQVKLKELPWVAQIESFRIASNDAREVARATLENVVRLALTAFPEVILPNKLLQELQALVARAELDVPIVNEIAADIFMGEFTEKYLRAAQQAGRLLAGSLYEQYYAIDYAGIQRLDAKKSWFGATTAPAFDALCQARAGVSPSGRSVASNGMLIEQEQILTTHNLAPLIARLGLCDALAPLWPELGRRTFAWICTQLQLRIDDWKPRLRMVKNVAYAWRQMVLYFSLLPAQAVDEFLAWATTHLAQQGEAFRVRFQPALDGLALVSRGGSLDAPPDGGPPVRRLLGWTTDRHWLLEADGGGADSVGGLS